MGHRTAGPNHSTNRGNRRTRSGPGRHNLCAANHNDPNAQVRICLGCNRPFKSHGPWNRFCGRCHLREDEADGVTSYHVPGEWPTATLRDDDF